MAKVLINALIGKVEIEQKQHVRLRGQISSGWTVWQAEQMGFSLGSGAAEWGLWWQCWPASVDLL